METSVSILIPQYAVKAQTSLAPLSRFRGSLVSTAYAHQCCRFQSYAKTVPSRMKLTKREPHSWDPRQLTTWSRRVTSDFNSVFLSMHCFVERKHSNCMLASWTRSIRIQQYSETNGTASLCVADSLYHKCKSLKLEISWLYRLNIYELTQWLSPFSFISQFAWDVEKYHCSSQLFFTK